MPFRSQYPPAAEDAPIPLFVGIQSLRWDQDRAAPQCDEEVPLESLDASESDSIPVPMPQPRVRALEHRPTHNPQSLSALPEVFDMKSGNEGQGNLAEEIELEEIEVQKPSVLERMSDAFKAFFDMTTFLMCVTSLVWIFLGAAGILPIFQRTFNVVYYTHQTRVLQIGLPIALGLSIFLFRMGRKSKRNSRLRNRVKDAGTTLTWLATLWLVFLFWVPVTGLLEQYYNNDSDSSAVGDTTSVNPDPTHDELMTTDDISDEEFNALCDEAVKKHNARHEAGWAEVATQQQQTRDLIAHFNALLNPPDKVPNSVLSTGITGTAKLPSKSAFQKATAAGSCFRKDDGSFGFRTPPWQKPETIDFNGGLAQIAAIGLASYAHLGGVSDALYAMNPLNGDDGPQAEGLRNTFNTAITSDKQILGLVARGRQLAASIEKETWAHTAARELLDASVTLLEDPSKIKSSVEKVVKKQSYDGKSDIEGTIVRRVAQAVQHGDWSADEYLWTLYASGAYTLHALDPDLAQPHIAKAIKMARGKGCCRPVKHAHTRKVLLRWISEAQVQVKSAK